MATLRKVCWFTGLVSVLANVLPWVVNVVTVDCRLVPVGNCEVVVGVIVDCRLDLVGDLGLSGHGVVGVHVGVGHNG